MRLALAALASLVLAAPAAAQGPITVYSSLPLKGASKPQTEAIVAGANLALQDAGGTAAGRPVRYVSLDDSTARARTWEPAQVAKNARRAAADPSALAYLGEFNSGASAISIPITNDKGLLSVSPSNTAIGLTRGGFGADRGEPVKYYPTGDRTYGRIVPNDRVQARAIAQAMVDDGVKRVTIVSDGEVYGSGMAQLVKLEAFRKAMRVTSRRLGRKGRNASAIAAAARRGDALFYGGITANGAPKLWNAVHRRKKSLKLYGADGIAESGFADRISRSAQARTKLSVATLAPSAYPPAGQAVLQRLGTNPDPYGIYGYEAMAVILDAINRAPTVDRAGVVKAFFATKDRDSVLGRYSIDPNGDTTLGAYGIYTISGGELVWSRAVDVG
jgi:branched-chain amino acid transport system substrate-binding protein